MKIQAINNTNQMNFGAKLEILGKLSRSEKAFYAKDIKEWTEIAKKKGSYNDTITFNFAPEKQEEDPDLGLMFIRKIKANAVIDGHCYDDSVGYLVLESEGKDSCLDVVRQRVAKFFDSIK